MLAKKFALGFGIAIIFPMMIYYGVSSFSPAPKWMDYQVENFQARHSRADVAEQERLEAEHTALENKFRMDLKHFQKHLFFVSVPLGIIVIIIGALLDKPAIGTGLIFGGVISVAMAYIGYWSELLESLRFVSLLVAFMVLIFVGYKKLEKR